MGIRRQAPIRSMLRPRPELDNRELSLVFNSLTSESRRDNPPLMNFIFPATPSNRCAGRQSRGRATTLPVGSVSSAK